MLLTEQENKPSPAAQGQGELEMTDVNQHLVQKELSELEDQVSNVILGCNEEKELIEEEFERV